MKRIVVALILGLLFANAASAANVYLYIGPTGQSLYGRVEETAGNFVAFALVEGTGGAKGKYYATEANMVAAGLDTASTGSGFIVTVHTGATPSTSAEDPIVASATLRWTGSAEDTSTGSGSGPSISPTFVDEDHTWGFDDRSQITSPNDVTESAAPAVLVQMDFTEPLPKQASILSITSVTIADVAAATKPTVTTSQVDGTKKKVIVTLNTATATAATYTVTIKALSIDNQTFTRKGRLNIQ